MWPKVARKDLPFWDYMLECQMQKADLRWHIECISHALLVQQEGKLVHAGPHYFESVRTFDGKELRLLNNQF